MSRDEIDEFDEAAGEFVGNVLGNTFDATRFCASADRLLLSQLKLTLSTDTVIEIRKYGMHMLPITKRRARLSKERKVTKSGWGVLFSKIDRKPVTLPLERGITRDEVIDGIELKPVDLTSISGEIKELYLKRASDETISGSAIRHRTTITLLRAMYGMKCRTTNIWGYFASYIDSLGDDEPLEEGRDQRSVVIKCKDGMVGTRALTFENALLMLYARPDLEDIIEEVMLYLLKSPYENTHVLKKSITAFKMVAGSLTTSGTKVSYTTNNFWDEMTIYDTKGEMILPTENDAWYYQMHLEPTVRPAEKFLLDNGMPKFFAFCSNLINRPIDRDAVRDHAFLYAVNGMTGFTRTNIVPSHLAVNKVELTGPFPNTAYSYMRDEVRDAFLYAKEQMPNYDHYRRQAYQYLRNTSAGGSFVKRQIAIQDKPYYRFGYGDGTDRVIDFKATQKPLVFLADPEYFLKLEPQKFTYEKPMRAGIRSVTDGKRRRKINMNALKNVPIGRILAQPQVRHQNYMIDHLGQSRLEEDPYSVPKIYTVGKESGRLMLDHSAGAVASSRGDILCEGSDYDAFDEHSKFENSGAAQMAGALQVVSEWGDFAPGWSWEKMIREYWGAGVGHDVWVKSKGTVSEATYMSEGLLSGLDKTLNYNNTTNRGLRLVISDTLARKHITLDGIRRSILSFIELKRIRIQGDDMIAYWRLTNNLSQRAKGELVDAVSTAVMQVARDNGQSVNKLKNIVRFYLTEYLKKVFWYGYFIPRGQLQLLAGENGGINSDSIGLLRNYGTLANLYANRICSDTKVDHVFMNIMANFRRNVRWSRAGSAGMIYMPFSVLWCPIALGGVGRLPWTQLGNNLDNVVAVECTKDPKFRESVNDAAEYASRIGSHIRDEIKRSMTVIAKKPNTRVTAARKEMFSEMAPGIAFLQTTLIKHKVYAARIASAKLREAGAPSLGSMWYPDRPVTDTVSALADSKQAGKLSIGEKIESGNVMLDVTYPPADHIGQKFRWIFSMEWTEGETLPFKYNDMDIPVVGASRETLDKVKVTGVSMANDEFRFNPALFLAIIHKLDQDFPRRITGEQIFNFISSPKIMGRDSLVFLSLVGMGANANAAQAAVDLLYSQGEGAAIKLQSIHSSLASEQLITSRSLETYNELVEVAQLPDKNLNQLVMETAYAIAVTGRNVKKQLPKWNDESIAVMYDTLGARNERVELAYSNFSNSIRAGVDPFNPPMHEVRL
jgi:hypothetical protein